MDYKELLTRCKTEPGWIADNKQKKVDSAIRYSNWVKKMDKELPEKKPKANSL